jgi:hypothetical protein
MTPFSGVNFVNKFNQAAGGAGRGRLARVRMAGFIIVKKLLNESEAVHALRDAPEVTNCMDVMASWVHTCVSKHFLLRLTGGPLDRKV